jgi:ADP-heptose:LPS heptosyltransferase
MHIASAVGTPIVAIFGSTDPHLTGPYGDTPARVLYKNLPCAPCNNHPTCGGRHDCLQEISPEEVVLAVSDLIRRKRILPIDAMASQGA